MKQPWIHSAKTDGTFILAPSFLVLAMVLIFHQSLANIQDEYSFYTWLFLIVFIDVAHVYATLFKTYFVKSEFISYKKRYIGLPILCFFVGCVLFAFGSQVFWSVLAYVAVFHFIRQQYGFMRLYARIENNENVWINNLVIYTATIYPMLHWFLSPKRHFNWFVENEFFVFENPLILKISTWIYFAILAFYVVQTIYTGIKNQFFNVPKHVIITGTILSWYFGIVYFNNDLIFTLLNVITHGIPYIALIYLNEIEKKTASELQELHWFKNKIGVLLFIFLLIALAFSEEYLWEILVWNEQFSNSYSNFVNWHFLLIPLLTVPQFTHYLLDGFIWKTKK
jgi:hypothetical protein